MISLPIGLGGAGTEPPVIDTSTALLLILIGVAAFLIKAVATLRRDVDELRARTPSAPLPEKLPAAAPRPADEIPPELQAVICAAVCVALEGAPARIVGISAPTLPAGWSLEGRRDVFSSHRVR